MGCDIHTQVERKVRGKWEMGNGKWEIIPGLVPFDWRAYGMFGFLADVRNYSAIPPIAPQRGLPDDVVDNENAENYLGDHSYSWLSVAELLAFNYDEPVEDRRVTRNHDGGCTAEPGGGRMTTYREFLGEAFFMYLEKLKEAGAERVVFGFDS